MNNGLYLKRVAISHRDQKVDVLSMQKQIVMLALLACDPPCPTTSASQQGPATENPTLASCPARSEPWAETWDHGLNEIVLLERDTAWGVGRRENGRSYES